jgi:hypothetical protein
MRDVLAGRFLLVSLVDQEGVRPTPYSPAIYLLLAPLAKIFGGPNGGPELMLRLWMPIIDATSALAVFYLLRRCRVPDPAPTLAAFFTTILAVASQLLWWGFFSNQFGQWATTLALTVVVGHWGELGNRRLFLLLVPILALPLLSHPSAFVMLCAFVPLLAAALALGTRDGRQGGILLLAFGLALLLAYLLYYRHFTALAIDYARNLSGDAAVRTADDAPGWEWNYIRLRVFSLHSGCTSSPRSSRRSCCCASGSAPSAGACSPCSRRSRSSPPFMSSRGCGCVLRLPRARAGDRRGDRDRPVVAARALGRGVAYAALAYGTATSLALWFTISIGGGRSIYP